MPFAAAVELKIMVGQSLSRSPLKAMIVMDSGSVLTWLSVMGPPQDKDDGRCPDSRKQGLPVISRKIGGIDPYAPHLVLASAHMPMHPKGRA